MGDKSLFPSDTLVTTSFVLKSLSQNRGKGPQIYKNANFNKTNDKTSSPSNNKAFKSFKNIARQPCQICNRLGHSAINYYHCIDHACEGRVSTKRLVAIVA